MQRASSTLKSYNNHHYEGDASLHAKYENTLYKNVLSDPTQEVENNNVVAVLLIFHKAWINN